MDLLGISILISVALVVLLGSGVWIAISLLACGWLGMQFAAGGIPAGTVLATKIWGNAASWELAALPLFIWMGEILFRTRLSEEMFRGLAPWLGRIPGRLLHVNVLGCGIFGSVSGSSAATCATIAKIALPELKKRGYPEMISLGSLAGSGTLGILIPPSITMVIYAVAANVSILKVFLAGFLPGPPGDGALLRLHRRVGAAQSRQDAAAGTQDVAAREAQGIAQPHPLPAADRARLLRAADGLGDRNGVRGLGRARRAAHRRPGPARSPGRPSGPASWAQRASPA